MAKPQAIDARKRICTQIRLYGDLAQMIDDRAEVENKSRSTLVDQLIRAAWAVDTNSMDIEPLQPARTFVRQQPAPDPEPEPPPRQRARVYSPQRL